MAFLLSPDSRRVTDLALEIPPAGGWMATLHMDSGLPPAPGPATLRIGDLALPGRILDRGGTDSPARPAVVVAGGDGWTKRLPVGAFASPTGVRLSTILAALAATSGEAYDAPPESLVAAPQGAIPASWGWLAGARGTAVLARLVAQGAVPLWRVDARSGRTRFDPWPALGPADAHGTIEDRRLAVGGVREVALSGSAAAWLPGATVQGVRIARVVLSERNEETRVSTWDA